MVINQIPGKKRKLNIAGNDIARSLIPVFRSRYFYIGIAAVLAGVELNFASQTYMFNHFDEGKGLPMLPDIILNNLPVYDVSLIYDLFSFVPILILLAYIVHRNEYDRIPFFLVLCGTIEIVRGIFIVLTPLGNPPMFMGSQTLFNGFSKYELGVYPSGHTGDVFLIFLMIKDKWYKIFIVVCLILVIISLFLSHAHYSIDILSGLLFAYAINSFGEKNLRMFDLGSNNKLYPS